MTYNEWIKIGSDENYIRKYNQERDESLKRAKKALEDAFTPELQKMLEKSLFIQYH